MKHTALADRTRSQLVLIDVQEKLCAVMPPDALPEVLRNRSILLQASRLLKVPTIHSEQYPTGLGLTRPELTQWLDGTSAIEKTCFSALEESRFCERLDDARDQLILTGMEAHVCILQTALQWQALGRQVFVVEDAVISRHPARQANAMARLRQAGVIISNTESVVFEWLRDSNDPAFKEIARLIR